MAVGEFRREGFHQPFVDRCRQGQRLGIAENFDGHAGSINDNTAITALAQMLLEGLGKAGIKFTVEVFRKLSYNFLAVQTGFTFLK